MCQDGSAELECGSFIDPMSRHWRKNRNSVRGPHREGIEEPRGAEWRERGCGTASPGWAPPVIGSAPPSSWPLCRASGWKAPRKVRRGSASPRGQRRGECGDWRCGPRTTHRKRRGTLADVSGCRLGQSQARSPAAVRVRLSRTTRVQVLVWAFSRSRRASGPILEGRLSPLVKYLKSVPTGMSR